MNKKMFFWFISTLILATITFGLVILLLVSTIQMLGWDERANSFPKLGFLPFIIFLLIVLIPLILNFATETKAIVSVKKGKGIDPLFNKKMFFPNIALAAFLLATFAFVLVLFVFHINPRFFSAVDKELMIIYSLIILLLLSYPLAFCLKFCPFKKNDCICAF